MPTELCITYLEMQVFAHIRLTIMSGPLMPSLTNLVLFSDAQCASFNFLSDHFRGLMLYTNLHFSSTVSRSNCMTVTNYSGCGCVVSVLLPQYFFCIATKTFRVLRGASRFLYFPMIPISPPQHVELCAKQTRKKVNI